jgi:hypothetical protein
MGAQPVQGCHCPGCQRGNVCFANIYYMLLITSSSYYKALTFYLQEQPTLLTDLLTVLIPRIDHSRVVRVFRQIDHIPLIRSYLIAVQHVRLLYISSLFFI